MLKKYFIVLLVISVLSVAVCTVSAVTFIRMGTAGSTGNYYRLGAGMASLWNTHFPDLQVSVQATGGSAENSELIADKEVEITFIGGDPAYQAYHNEGQWAERTKDRYKVMKFVSHAYPNPFHLAVMEWAPKVETIRDLKGKRVAVGMLGSHGENVWRDVMDILGWTYDDIKATYATGATAMDMIRNRQLDAIWDPDAVGSSFHNELADTGKARWIDIDEDVIEKMTQGQNFAYTIPVGSIGQPNPVRTFAYSAIIVAHEDVDEDIIYKLTKSMYENIEFLETVHPIARYMILEHALNGQPFELHPGAEKYYREMGVIK